METKKKMSLRVKIEIALLILLLGAIGTAVIVNLINFNNEKKKIDRVISLYRKGNIDECADLIEEIRYSDIDEFDEYKDLVTAERLYAKGKTKDAVNTVKWIKGNSDVDSFRERCAIADDVTALLKEGEYQEAYSRVLKLGEPKNSFECNLYNSVYFNSYAATLVSEFLMEVWAERIENADLRDNIFWNTSFDTVISYPTVYFQYGEQNIVMQPDGDCVWNVRFIDKKEASSAKIYISLSQISDDDADSVMLLETGDINEYTVSSLKYSKIDREPVGDYYYIEGGNIVKGKKDTRFRMVFPN
ncbi:MAG: hypothetical protein IJJ74_09680 [Eubacterium sp.]|nr:hypothetical protein [Eubacterium sp.]